jgi:hypothetical protein
MDVHWAKDYSNKAHGDQGKQTDDVNQCSLIIHGV